MKVAPILGLRRAIVSHLRADATVTALVPAARLYGERVPAEPDWPFMRYGQSDAGPGFEIVAPIHVFSKAEFPDEAAEIGEAIGASLENRTLTLGDGRRAHLRWLSGQIIPDAAEASAWHAIVRIGATVAAECVGA